MELIKESPKINKYDELKQQLEEIKEMIACLPPSQGKDYSAALTHFTNNS